MDGQEWLASYRGRIAGIGARVAQAQRALAGVEATATSRDGAITVTVNPAGALQRLVLSERTTAMTRVQLAELVVATARQAQGDAARLATEAVAPLIGERSEAMHVLRSYLPVEERTR